MSKNVAMFVDVANMYYAARGQDVDVDYVALLKHATKGRDLIRAYAYTGLDPENENQRKFIDFLAKNGYKPVVKDIRKFGDGRMKANLDIELVVDLFRLADRMDIAVIVSGDGDFAPAIRALQDTGVRCEVVSFKPNTSSDLIAVADEFFDIMKVASISRKKGEAPSRASMSAPEMPAKEVTPEFGFREASPAVAAAALAALKSGGPAAASGNGRRSRGGASSPRRPASADAPVEAAPAVPSATETIAEGGEEARRRRRRRGGRGRGRSRRDDEPVDAAAAAPAGEAGAAGAAGEEIGWEEFDDLSQLDGAAAEAGASDDREYTFEDADAATLAELGIDPEAAETATDDKPKRRTRSAKPDAGEAASDEEKPKRRTRSAKPDAGEADADAGADAEAKPRRRTRSAKTDEGPSTGDDKPKRRTRSTRSDAGADASSAAEGSGEDGEPQGIWGRFRSARKPRTTTSG